MALIAVDVLDVPIKSLPELSIDTLLSNSSVPAVELFLRSCPAAPLPAGSTMVLFPAVAGASISL
jgi:hypothetical protein